MDKDMHVPAALLARQQLDSGVSAERLRHEPGTRPTSTS
jgi:hypothetical protein